MPEYGYGREDEHSWYRVLFITGLIIIVLAVIGGLVYAVALPAINNANRSAVQNSNEYVQTKQHHLLELVDQYMTLDTKLGQIDNTLDASNGYRAQQKNVLAQIYAEAELISPDAIPDTVKEFMGAHPKGYGFIKLKVETL